MIEFHEKLGRFFLGEKAPAPIMHRKTGDVIIREGEAITQEMLESSGIGKARRSDHGRMQEIYYHT